MNLFKNAVVLLTGADGGIGTSFVNELIKKKVRKIYITGINKENLLLLASNYPDILFPVLLDVTNPKEIKDFCSQYRDINILINNAGVELKSDFLNLRAHEFAQFEMSVNYIGIVNLTNELLPILKSNSNSAIINILSIASLSVIKRLSTYCASKTAAHIFTQSIREDLLPFKIKVFGIYPGYVDTSMSSDITYQKISPNKLVENICNEINLDKFNVFPDPMSLEFAMSDKLNMKYVN